jgi:predicted DsbA family dithiol-disulfide isomerase
MKVTVFYDYNCPYCYLGSMSLNELSKEFEMEIEWKGFEIHPEFPYEGRKRSKSMKSIRVSRGVLEMARQDGFQIKLPGFAANSRLGLEGSEFAKSKGLFKEFHEGVYEAYFKKGLNIGDMNILLEIGSITGLDEAELREALKSRSMYEKIEDNRQEARNNSILGVPTYIFGKFPLHGYQPTETFRKIIQKAFERS